MRLYHGTSTFAAVRSVKAGAISDFSYSLRSDRKKSGSKLSGFVYFARSFSSAVGFSSWPDKSLPAYKRLISKGVSDEIALVLTSPAMIIVDVNYDKIIPDPEDDMEESERKNNKEMNLLKSAFMKDTAFRNNVKKFAESEGFDISGIKDAELFRKFMQYSYDGNLLEVQKFMAINLPLLYRKEIIKMKDLFMVKGPVPIKEAFYWGPHYEMPGIYKGDVQKEADLKTKGILITKAEANKIIASMKRSAGL